MSDYWKIGTKLMVGNKEYKVLSYKKGFTLITVESASGVDTMALSEFRRMLANESNDTHMDTQQQHNL